MQQTDIRIYTSANNGEEILILPIIPKNLPKIVEEWQHEEFTTNERVLTLIGKRKRKNLDLEFLLPCGKNYKSIIPGAVDGMQYVRFWQKWSEKEVPMRLIIARQGEVMLNIAYTIDDFSYYFDKKKDIIANLSITEYIFTQDDYSEKETVKYQWENVNLRYNGGGFAVQGSNVNGRWLVPVRKFLELIGYTVEWIGDTKQIKYTLNGESKILKTDFEIYEGTSYGYIYQMAAEVGKKLSWNDDEQTISIS